MNPRQRKLTREQVRVVVARYEAGDTLAAIAADHGVSGSAISYQVAKHTVLRRDRPLPATCGTRRGYSRHYALGQSPCVACKAAHRDYMRDYHRAKAAATAENSDA